MFENLHANHKLAYLDGFLCGIAVTYLAKQIYQDIVDIREFEKLAAETDQK